MSSYSRSRADQGPAPASRTSSGKHPPEAQQQARPRARTSPSKRAHAEGSLRSRKAGRRRRPEPRWSDPFHWIAGWAGAFLGWALYSALFG